VSKVTVTAKTVEEAVKSALSQLQTTEEFINIRVIEEPSKGFFGIGSKQAVVEVELIQSASHEESKDISSTNEQMELNAVEEGQAFLEKVLDQMGIEAHIDQEHQDDHTLFQISGSNIGILIGRRGQTLDSIQYLTNIVVNRHSKDYIRIIVDAENYRGKRKETLEQLADRVAKKVIRTRNRVVLEPMNPAERKIIHTHLQDYSGVATKSDGVEPNRRIVILPK
jgi:spoIIIJ-associated protein